ncbi:hypothetical protein ACHQM5_015419 [Ranunculus cassubicifolius]
MLSSRSISFKFLCLILLIICCVLRTNLVSSFVVPNSSCYAFDNSSHIHDFTSLIGHHFEYDGKDTDTALRFCKDVESRSQGGYVDYGRFDTFNDFATGSGHFDFVQGFYNGDLANCETSFDKLGRTAQVNIICGNCLSGDCKGGLGCICNVTYESTCRVIVDLAIPCEKKGPRVFEGFTVGLHPRSWEVVYNGMTNLGFEKLHHEFSFETEQTHVSLYMTAISSVSSLVGKPMFKVTPEKGLDVKLSGSGATGIPPTTLSPTMLNVDWTCESARDTPYEVFVSIPVEGYEPIEFTLTKICKHRQDRKDEAARGWAAFGVISCIFIVMSTVLCCGGFIYKTRVQHQHGLDALPGMTLLSACLETVTGGVGYSRSEDLTRTFVNQATWERPPVSTQTPQVVNDRKYGSI